MLSESYFVSISGQPITKNTAISRDVGIYEQTLQPSHATVGTFKKSSAPKNCLAVSDSHVFAAQEDKSTVHVYSRIRGNQEAVVTLPERITSICLRDDVLVLGSKEGRILLWETCTGRLVTTPPSHVQAVSCLATTPFHIISGSDDSNLHVWELARLLALDAGGEFEPKSTLSHHRAPITALTVGQSVNPDSSICVSASKDKSCIVWNYQTGLPLRTLLFPSSPLALCLDPCARAVYVSCDGGSLFAVDFFAEKVLVGAHSSEESSTAVQVSSPFGTAPEENGSALCLGINYDGTVLLTGHPQGNILRWDLGSHSSHTELTNLNSAVTSIQFVPPLKPGRATSLANVVKPFLGARDYNFTAEFNSDLTGESNFEQSLNYKGFSQHLLEKAVLSFSTPTETGGGDEKLRAENEELWQVIHEQRKLQQTTMQHYLDARPAAS